MAGNGTCLCDSPGFSSISNCSDCNYKYYGSNCTSCTADCHYNGHCNDGTSGDGTCLCDANWDKISNCSSCIANWNVSVYCRDCVTGRYGPSCSNDCTINCNKHGNCKDGIHGDGTCFCYDKGFTDESNCSACHVGYYGPSCLVCNRDCNNHGKCNDSISGDGTCNCATGWNKTGDCYDCTSGIYGTACNFTCEVDCSGHGHCNDGTKGDGTCNCDNGWDVKTKCAQKNFTGTDNTIAIVFGVIGGLLAIGAGLGAIYYYMRYRRQRSGYTKIIN